MPKIIVITSWYFNPIHPWHIECLELCKSLWDELRVIVNNDQQVLAKTGSIFQNQDFRMRIVSSIKTVDEVFLAVDVVDLINDPLIGICESLRTITPKIRNKYWPDTKIIFGKWWDRFSDNIPELQVCKDHNIEIRDWLWSKTHNSSEYRKKAGK